MAMDIKEGSLVFYNLEIYETFFKAIHDEAYEQVNIVHHHNCIHSRNFSVNTYVNFHLWFQDFYDLFVTIVLHDNLS